MRVHHLFIYDTHILKTQCWLIWTVQAVDLHSPIIPSHQDVLHTITNNVKGINTKHTLKRPIQISMASILYM